MLEIELTSHSAIGPYVVVAVVEFAIHAVTAIRMFASTRQSSGYAARNVAPHATYNRRLLARESAGVESKAGPKLVTRSTFHIAMF